MTIPFLEDELAAPFERVPCDDDTCIGIVDTDGKCGTCGRACVGRAPSGLSRQETDAPEEPAADTSTTISLVTSDIVFDPEERVPCPDETCIGIIGEHGRCGTCGRPS